MCYLCEEKKQIWVDSPNFFPSFIQYSGENTSQM